MPNRDGTGPRGLGQSTGLGLGKCNQNSRRNFSNGRGRGLGRKYYQMVNTPESLNEEKKFLEERLNYIKKELGE